MEIFVALTISIPLWIITVLLFYIPLELIMKKILWFLLSKFDSNWGYSTPLQKRFKVGDRVKISTHSKLIAHTPATIVETGRHDYLIEDDTLQKYVVYQFELYQ